MSGASAQTIELKGKAYLPARQRVRWLREDHPTWGIETGVVELDFTAGYAVIRASILDETGRVIATALKQETRADFPDFVEKAETGAIGRACAVAGYGTEDAVDLDEGAAIADAPVARKATPQAVKDRNLSVTVPTPLPPPESVVEDDVPPDVWAGTVSRARDIADEGDSDTCREHGVEWRGDPGDRYHRLADGHGYCRNAPGNVPKRRSA